jgi:hypothetical protein
MARIRTVKPEFWTSAQIMECSPMARLLFIGMWNFADDAGRMAYSPKTLKAQIYPSDDIKIQDVERLIVELSTNGLILIYSAEDKEFIQVTGWQHQKIDKPKKSNIPAPFVDESSIIRRPVATDPILSNRIVTEPEAVASGAEAPPVPDPSEPERQFFARVREVLGKSGGGQGAKLLRVCGGNVALARSKLELAATKDNTAAFLAAVINAGPQQQRTGKPLTQHQIERQTARDIIDDLGAFSSSRSGCQDDLGFLPGDPGQRPQGLRGGSGGDVIDLPAIGYQTRR